MQFFRQSSLITRLVLVWFALFVGVAAASPLIKPQAMELICASSGAMKLVFHTDGSSSETAPHTLDCSLCGTVGAPPPVIQFATGLAPSLDFALKVITQARIAALVGAPLPARGPPLFS